MYTSRVQRQTRALDDPHVVPGQIGGAAGRRRRDDEVVPGDLDGIALAPSRKQLLHQRMEALQRRGPAYGRERHVDQQYGEGQVDASGDDGVDGTVGDVELEQRPAERQQPEEPSDRDRSGDRVLPSPSPNSASASRSTSLLTVSSRSGGVHGDAWPVGLVISCRDRWSRPGAGLGAAGPGPLVMPRKASGRLHQALFPCSTSPPPDASERKGPSACPWGSGS